MCLPHAIPGPKCSNAYAFESVSQVRDLTDTWLESYNIERPHDSTGPHQKINWAPNPLSSRPHGEAADQRNLHRLAHTAANNSH